MAGLRLAPLDAVFLRLEARDTPMHVAALMVFDIPKAADDDFVTAQVANLRASTEVYRPWNLVLKRPGRFSPLPAMVENHDLDMEYHVRHLALPRPGGERELGQMIARLHSQPLDLRKPLWECHVIEGLENRRFALYLKFHHALADGVSGARMLTRALSQNAADENMPAFWSVPDKQNNRPADSEFSAGPRLPAAKDVLRAAGEALRTWTVPGKGDAVSLRDAPHSILNKRIYAQRRFATHHEPLARLKKIAKAADATLNDIVLAITGTALREYLAEINALPKQSLTASIPVSMHGQGGGSANNVSMIFATLGTDVADTRLRVEAIRRSTAQAKARLAQLPPGAQTLYPVMMFAPLMGAVAAGLAGRTKPVYNVTVSNVPGGKEPLYLNGARLAHLYPVSIAMHGVAVNVTCFSQAGNLNFGILACRDSLPHMQHIAVGMAAATDRLEALYCGKRSGKPAATTRAKKRKIPAPS